MIEKNGKKASMGIRSTTSSRNVSNLKMQRQQSTAIQDLKKVNTKRPTREFVEIIDENDGESITQNTNQI